MSIQIANAKIAKAIAEHSIHIDLSCLGLLEIPDNLRQANWLQRLNVSSNNIKSLPTWLHEFTDLEVLDARSNSISILPSEIYGMNSLKQLHFRFNKLTEVDEELSSLPNLTYLNIADNNISRLHAGMFRIPHLNIDNNPVIDPPVEVYSRGYEATKNYFMERTNGTEKLYESKLLIVGEPGAGKTTLLNLLLDENYDSFFTDSSTKGIKIEPYYFETSDGTKFRVNIWDFGGQEIYHTTHQFFLTKRSLYVLLSDNRAENTDFNYWLSSIELLSDESPLLLLQNEKSERKHRINNVGMQERFGILRNTFSFNLKLDKKSLSSFKRAIQHQIGELPHIGTELPKIWVVIRKELEEKSKTVPYITDWEYLEICRNYGMEEKERAWFLSDYFHDLGVLLHFKDNVVLKRWIILKPDWGTEAVYRVLDNRKVIDSNGYFSKADLAEIWREEKYRDMHDELISLMMKFELCYRIEDSNNFIAAQLLQVAKPVYRWSELDNITFKYTYEFMPKGILTRFIVRMNDYIENQKNAWRDGVVLYREGTWAEVIETYGKNEIRIRIRGDNKKEFLAIILDSIDKINLSYSNLKVQKLIPCTCNKCRQKGEPHYFEFNYLRECLRNDVNTERCHVSFDLIKIRPLIDDVLGAAFNKRGGGIKVFVSSHSDDAEESLHFIKHLKALEKSEKLTISDMYTVPAGVNEKIVIRERLDTSDVIISLISANYFNSETSCNEMTKALDRTETKSCLYIPVIIKDCDWRSLPISEIRPVLYNGNGLVRAGTGIDEAMVDAVSQVKMAIREFRLGDDVLGIEAKID
ncbi:COR domain-containing protein [Paraflavitalea pollutisoli]|uniref:COR domain-containing protein n=1 Tax=Paraflavitalea pollutisoli TaxID=3034143 RepID=UPI0023EDEC3B|nr:COR domain-containing protein [Paraflavitalea sp. H1-2-19X]